MGSGSGGRVGGCGVVKGCQGYQGCPYAGVVACLVRFWGGLVKMLQMS